MKIEKVIQAMEYTGKAEMTKPQFIEWVDYKLYNFRKAGGYRGWKPLKEWEKLFQDYSDFEF